MIRKHKKYSRPRKLYESQRIADENVLVENYGLKSKREIWRTEARVRYFRTRAKQLITASQKEQESLFNKLRTLGLNVSSVADVLALNKEDLLKRRLSSVLVAKNMATTPKQARQMITHKRVFIEGTIVNSPGYLVSVNDENHISIKHAKIAAKKVEGADA